jgi:signal transduction protein with GAF and PtsI domain
MQLQVCSRGFLLHLGEGLPGRVWKSQQPEWLEDASTQSETYFLRNQIAKALSVKAGLGIPMMMDSQVVAVVVFFMSRARSLDPDLVDRTQAIVKQFQPSSVSP